MSDITSQVPAATDNPASTGPAPRPSMEPRLRLWPAVVFVALQWIALKVLPWLVPGTVLHFYGMMLGPLIGTVGVLGWWLFASRIRWRDRLFGALAFVAVGAIIFPLLDPFPLRDPTVGMMVVFFHALPAATTAIVLWLLVTPFLRWPVRRATLLALLVLTWGYYTLVRYDGATGEFSSELTYRWIPRAEEKHQADVAAGKIGTAKPVEAESVKPLVLQAGDWPGFRGPGRDGRLMGVKIATNWQENPPKLVWRHRVGPSWSSFAVIGKHLFTQEQLGKEELVVCYDADTGATVWVHKDPARFTEKFGGPGPRATPTFHEGKLYVLGAKGVLNCLDAATGQKAWSCNIVDDSGGEVPVWGFASSPLVVQGLVTVFAGAGGGKSVLAYDASSGAPVWQAGEGQASYCSLQPARLGGVEQLLVATEKGLTAFHPTRGEILWNHEWDFSDMQRVVQPAILNDSDVLLGTAFGNGIRRLRVSKSGSVWEAQEVWTSRAISPYFNDLVVQGGYLYGFDNAFFTCVGLEDGKKKWRARGYGAGQVLLLADQNLLLVLSEKGAVALVEATPDEHREIARFQAIDGKTWNHPVVVHGKLFVRNSEEAACYQLTEISAGRIARGKDR